MENNNTSATSEIQSPNKTTRNSSQTIALAALAILGHRSAHSFPMGPVMADPIIITSNKSKSK